MQYPIYEDPSSPENIDRARREALEIVRALGGDSIAGALSLPETQTPHTPDVVLDYASKPLIPELTPEEISQTELEARQEVYLLCLDTEPKLYLHLAESLLPRLDKDPSGNPLNEYSSWIEGAPATHMLFELVHANAAIGETDKANEILEFFSTSENYTARNGLKRVEELAAAQIASEAGGFESQKIKVQELRQRLIEDVKADEITLNVPVPGRQTDQQISQAVDENVASTVGRWEKARSDALNPSKHQDYEQLAVDLEKHRTELLEEAVREKKYMWLPNPHAKGPRLIDAGKLEQVQYVIGEREKAKIQSTNYRYDRGYQYWSGVLRELLLPDAQLAPSSAPSHLMELFIQGGPKEVATAVATATKLDKNNRKKDMSANTMIAVCEFAIGRQKQLWHEMPTTSS